MIEAVRLGAVSRERTLWDGLDLAIGDGEFRVLTGPPSSGKTLLIRMLQGLLRPHAGDVLVDGISLYRGGAEPARAFRARAGSIPECVLPFPGRTVDDLFRLSALAAGGIRREVRQERGEELLAMVGLPGAQGWETASLSCSERARAALAAELFRDPKYLFAEALLANAGDEWSEKLMMLFRALAREGKTIVLSERTLPGRWVASADKAETGPFLLFRLTGEG